MPASEVSILFQEIADLTGKKVSFPSGYDRGFLVEFLDDGTPRPRFLGISTSKTTFDHMASHAPPRDPRDNIPDRSLLAFKAKIESVLRATKAKKNKAKEKKAAERIQQKRSEFDPTISLILAPYVQPLSQAVPFVSPTVHLPRFPKRIFSSTDLAIDTC